MFKLIQKIKDLEEELSAREELSKFQERITSEKADNSEKDVGLINQLRDEIKRKDHEMKLEI